MREVPGARAADVKLALAALALAACSSAPSVERCRAWVLRSEQCEYHHDEPTDDDRREAEEECRRAEDRESLAHWLDCADAPTCDAFDRCEKDHGATPVFGVAR